DAASHVARMNNARHAHGYDASGFGAASHAFAGRSRADRIARLDTIATLLDTAFVIPGTNIRFGLDGLIGLFPGIGDVVTTATSLWLVHEAHQLGAPGPVIMRMLANVALDGVVGAVPVFGDVFDVMWRANKRNMRLLRDWLDTEPTYR